MNALAMITAGRSPADLIATIREQLGVARTALDAGRATDNLDIADGHFDIYDRALDLIFAALIEAEDGLMLIEVERMFSAIYGRV